MKNIIKLLPYILINAMIFYLLPIFIKNTSAAMIVMLVGIPVLCFVTAMIYGIKNSFQWIYPLLVILLFVPSLFVFYNYTACHILSYMLSLRWLAA